MVRRWGHFKGSGWGGGGHSGVIWDRGRRGHSCGPVGGEERVRDRGLFHGSLRGGEEVREAGAPASI